jgi:hypothetical protein
MFSHITIVRLTDSDPLLSLQIPWGAGDVCDQNRRTNIEMLIEAGLFQSYFHLADWLVSQCKNPMKSVVIPVHYHLSPSGAYVEILGDLSSEHYASLTKILSEYIPSLVSVESQQLWCSDYEVEGPASSEWVIDIAKHQTQNMQQEIEMVLYEHEINQARGARQLRAISGVWIIPLGTKHDYKRGRAKLLVTDVSWLKGSNDKRDEGLLARECTLVDWLKNPTDCTTVVLGEDAGDHEVEALKACMLGMLGSGRCQSIVLIEPDGRRIYHSNLFSKIIYRFKKIAHVG